MLALAAFGAGGCSGGGDPDTTTATGPSPAALKAALLEEVRKQAIARGLDPKTARCATERLETSLSDEDLAAIVKDPSSLSPELTKKFAAAGHACAAGG